LGVALVARHREYCKEEGDGVPLVRVVMNFVSPCLIVVHSCTKNAPCRNPSLGLATKTRGYKVMGQVGDSRVTSHAPVSAKSMRESTFTLSSELPWWELESQMDFQNFREQFQGTKLNDL
jgi:hypothetical protein